jgi:putative intracellular protease/amidase
MQTGMHGRRVALVGGAEVAAVRQALIDAGAEVEELSAEADDSRWHSAAYAALVVTGSLEGTESDRALQLVREFLVADKPVAAHGQAVKLLLASGGLAGRTVAMDDDFASLVTASGATTSQDAIYVDESVVTAKGSADLAEFAQRVIKQFGERLEERQVDEMSDMSFPASDPPAVSPASIGPAPDEARGKAGDREAR